MDDEFRLRLIRAVERGLLLRRVDQLEARVAELERRMVEHRHGYIPPPTYR